MMATTGIAAVVSTVFLCISQGTLHERFDPVHVQSGLLAFRAMWVAMAAATSALWSYAMRHVFTGYAGASFMTNQFWCSLMFAPHVIGTINATAAG